MSTGENIRNAVQVLIETYRSTQKLLNHCRTLAEERGYRASSDKFLRWRSDSDPAGWLVSSALLPFQRNADPPCASGNGCLEGPTYAAEVFLGSDWDNELERTPQLYIARYDFDGDSQWVSPRWSPADHWIFHNPLHGVPDIPITVQGDHSIAVPDSPRTSERYYHLTRAVFRSFPLLEVTAENLEALVFDTFDALASLEPPEP